MLLLVKVELIITTSYTVGSEKLKMDSYFFMSQFEKQQLELSSKWHKMETRKKSASTSKLSWREVHWGRTPACPGTSQTLPASHIFHFPPLTRHHFFWSRLFRSSQLMPLLICSRCVDGPSWLNVKLRNIAGEKKKLFQLKHHSQLSTLNWWKLCMTCSGGLQHYKEEVLIYI